MSKQLLVDTILFEVSPELVNESISQNKPLVVTGILQRADTKNQNGRVYPHDILMREAKKYADVQIKERRALGELDHPECVRPSGEILTKNGWKFLKDISVGESVLTLNTNTNSVEWNTVNRVINQPYKGKMISIVGKNINTLVTPNHKFIVKDRNNNFIERTAQELLDSFNNNTDTHLSIPIVSENWNGVDYDVFEIEPYLEYGGTIENRDKQKTSLILDAESWFSFLGFYLAEGHCVPPETHGYGIHITQNDGEVAEKFRKVLISLSQELNWKEHKKNDKCVTFTVYDARLWNYLNKLGDKYTKYIPDDIKNASPRLLSKLFEWFLLGDGTTVGYKYKRQSIFSVSKKLIEDFNEILIKLGGVGVIKEQISKTDYMYCGHLIEVKNKSILYRLYIKKSNAIHLDKRFISINEVDYDSTVHCVTVDNGTFYCRDNGKPFWSGNSSIVNLNNVSHNVKKMWWESNNLLGEVEVLGTPAGNILKELFRAGIKLGISSRGLGSVQMDENSNNVVQEDFELIAFDFVSNPSTQGAFMFPGSLNESIDPTLQKQLNKYAKINRIITEILTGE